MAQSQPECDGGYTQKLILWDIRQSTLRSNWTKRDGYSQEISYFTGVETRNPSGTTTNVDTITYKDADGVVIFSEQLTYNAVDGVTKIENIEV